jgi:hypothetical protein
MYQEESVERAFAVNDQAALVLCDYTKGERPEVPMPYYSENFTGSEYGAAILMMKYGLVKEGVECIANIRRRFDGEQSNPYCEVEWGRHYARAMASWGAIPALSGFLYNGLTQEMEMKPLVHAKEFCSFWSSPTAWGSARQTVLGGSSQFVLEPKRGQIAIRQLRLDSSIFSGDRATVVVGDNRVPCLVERHGTDALFVFKQEVRVSPSASLILSAL